MTDFGNQSWLLYVVLAYGSSVAICLAFGVWSFLGRNAAIRSLADEGFMSQDSKENP